MSSPPQTGHLVFFYLEDWTVVNEYRHTMGLRHVFPEVNGTRVVFVDERSEGHIFNPVRTAGAGRGGGGVSLVSCKLTAGNQ